MIAADRLAHTSAWVSRPLAEKALLALGLLALALTMPPLPGALLVLAVALAAAWASGAPMPAFLRLGLGPLAFILTGALTLAVEIGPDGVRLAADHGAQALALALRSAAAVASLLLLAVTTPAATLVQGLRRLGLPPELAEVALATYRFLFVLSDTAAAIHASQQARLGMTGWRRRLRSTGLLAAALLPRALDRAHRLEVGLAARGFDGSLATLSPVCPARPGGLAKVALVLVVVGGAGFWI